MNSVVTEAAQSHDKEIVFMGTKHECDIFLDAYLLAMVVHTSYTFDAKLPETDRVFLFSPLVSQENFFIYIEITEEESA